MSNTSRSVGDTLKISGTAQDANGTVVFPTGTVAALHVGRPDGTTVSHPAVLTIATGAWSFTGADTTDLTIPGSYAVELQVTYPAPDNSVVTFGMPTFPVRHQLA